MASVMEAGADLPGHTPTQADLRLKSVCGDCPHANDGRHLDGEAPNDKLFQGLWKRVVQLPLRQCELPKGRVGRRFVGATADLFRGVRECTHNAEKVILFGAVVPH